MMINWNLERKKSMYLDNLMKEYELPTDFQKFITVTDATTENEVKDKVLALHNMLKAYAKTYVEMQQNKKPKEFDFFKKK